MEPVCTEAVLKAEQLVLQPLSEQVPALNSESPLTSRKQAEEEGDPNISPVLSASERSPTGLG